MPPAHRLGDALQRHWALAWPLILANAAIPLLGLADAAIAGHLEEAYFLAAVTVGAELFAIFFGSFSFLRMGTTGLVAQATGQQSETLSLRILGNALLLGAVLGVSLTLLGRGFVDPIIDLMQPAGLCCEDLNLWCEMADGQTRS